MEEILKGTGRAEPGQPLWLPEAKYGIVVRTDFFDEQVWHVVFQQALTGGAMFPPPFERAQVPNDTAGRDFMLVLQQVDSPTLVVVNDRRFAAATAEQVRAVAQERDHVFLADAVTMTDSEHLLLALEPTYSIENDSPRISGSRRDPSTERRPCWMWANCCGRNSSTSATVTGYCVVTGANGPMADSIAKQLGSNPFWPWSCTKPDGAISASDESARPTVIF
ncbi:hypothetical protein [Kineosporia sp. NBRC 101677]|uniref:DUF6924 domain-containing protein n=1 Tax=Kineosporia sp. NBRC 101677 TaxID=3032197 RepID=UPI002554F2E0|nr:hypothetical protein [Kineosporia sp. NBRC 101677]